MINKTFLFRIYHTLFPLRGSISRFRLWNKVILGKGSKCDKTTFEGMNALMENARVQACNIGLGTYVGSNTNLQKTKVGRFCSIADHVNTGFGSHPTKCFVTTFPAFYYDTKNLGFSFYQGGGNLFDIWKYVDPRRRYLVEIGNDVWIGSHVLIMDGIKIGDGAIVAAGAVVAKDVEPYSIVGGVPARHIRYRFTKAQIVFLLSFKWWERNITWIKEHYQEFQNIESFIQKIRNE